MTDLLTLNGLVWGQDHNDMLQVSIARTQSIADLKEQIKEKESPGFDHISSNTLILSIFNDVQSVTPFGGESLSSLVEGLRDIFSPQYIHVVVQPPSPPGERHKRVTSTLAYCIPLSPLGHAIRTYYTTAELLGSRRPVRSHLSCHDRSEQVGGVSQGCHQRENEAHI